MQYLPMMTGAIAALVLAACNNTAAADTAPAQNAAASDSAATAQTAAPAAPASAATATVQIPEAFRGRWDQERPACAEGEPLLVIDATGYQYPVQSGDVTQVEQTSPTSIRLTAGETGGEEGDPVVPTPQRWVLSQNNQVLTITGEGRDAGGPTELYRCTSE